MGDQRRREREEKKREKRWGMRERGRERWGRA